MRTLFLALALASPAIVAGPAVHAQASGGHYTAVAAVAPAKATLITRTTPWRCAGTTCVAGQAPERPAVLCELVVQRIGRLESFAVAGTPLDPAALEKCNARAK